MANSKVAEAISKIEEDGLTPSKCEKFLKTYSKVLHPNHAHMLDIKFSLLNLLGHSEGFTMSQLTEEQLSVKVNKNIVPFFITRSSFFYCQGKSCKDLFGNC